MICDVSGNPKAWQTTDETQMRRIGQMSIGLAAYPIVCYNGDMQDTPQGERGNSGQDRRISIRFPLDVLSAIRRLAKQHERSFNGEVIWALRDYAQRQEQQQKASGGDGA